MGIQWRDLPIEFGPWKSVYTRFRRWCQSGQWSRILEMLSADAEGPFRHFDCTHIKAHQDASNGAGGREAQAIGKTKGGLNTKVAAVVDAFGRVVGLNLAPGNRHDIKAITPLLKLMSDCWAVGDRGFDSQALRKILIEIGAKPCIPPRRSNRIAHYFSDTLYAHRHLVENFFGRIKRFRRIGTRYEKLTQTFLGFLTIAAIVDWIRSEV